MQRLIGTFLCLICFGCMAFANEEPHRDAFVKAAKDFESYANGKHLVLESGTDRIVLELNADQLVMRLVLEQRDVKANVLTHRYGHYVSIPLGQHVRSTSAEDPRAQANNIILHSVEFLPPETTIAKIVHELGALNFVIHDKLISEFIVQSKCTSLPSGSGRRGIGCQSPGGGKAEVWMNDQGQLVEVIVETRPGEKLSDGRVCPPGSWSKITRKLVWNASTRQLDEIQNSVTASGGVSGSRKYVIKEESQIPPLGVLIDLADFQLTNGVEVSCEAQPKRKFQFLDGKILGK